MTPLTKEEFEFPELGEPPDMPSDIPYWHSAAITMPWGMRTYRWHGVTKQGSPKIVESWSPYIHEWEECKNINVFKRIANEHKPNLNTND